jgi:hypothetical protein
MFTWHPKSYADNFFQENPLLFLHKGGANDMNRIAKGLRSSTQSIIYVSKAKNTIDVR